MVAQAETKAKEVRREIKKQRALIEAALLFSQMRASKACLVADVEFRVLNEPVHLLS